MTARRTTLLAVGMSTVALSALAPPAPATGSDVEAATSAAVRSGPRTVRLGTLDGLQLRPTAVNARGQVVGATVGDAPTAFRWDAGTVTDLGFAVPLESAVYSQPSVDVNDAGQVVGGSAWLWEGGVLTDLGGETTNALVITEDAWIGSDYAAVGGGEPDEWAFLPVVRHDGQEWAASPFPPFVNLESALTDVNDHGVVLGEGRAQSPGWDHEGAYLWEAGVVTPLGDQDVAFHGTDLDDDGRVVGWLEATWWTTPGGPGAPRTRGAAVWADGVTTRLGVPAGQVHSWAEAVNERGLVVGGGSDADGSDARAVVWRTGTVTTLGAAGTTSVAADVNDAGQVAGVLSRVRGDGVAVSRAFVWQRGVMTLLGTETAGVVTVADLSEKGHVVGTLDGRGVLWTVPPRRS